VIADKDTVTQLVNDPNDACVAYNRDDPLQAQQWRCLEEQKASKLGQRHLLFESQTYHFTSVSLYIIVNVRVNSLMCTYRTFAVLLGSTAVTGADSIDWIWITSIVMVGGSLVAILLLVLVYIYSQKFRARVGGFRGGRSIDVLLEKVR